MKSKSGVSLFLCLLVMLPLFGCNASPSPENTLKSYFDAVKLQDIQTMQSLSITGSSSTSASVPSSSSEISNAENKFMYLIFSKIDLTIEDTAKISGGSASIKAKITSPNTKRIMQNSISEAFSNTLSKVLSDSNSPTNVTNSAAMKMFTDELSKPDVALITTEMNIQLKKVNEHWKVVLADNLQDAMSGGISSYLKRISSGFESDTTSNAFTDAQTTKASSVPSSVKQKTSSSVSSKSSARSQSSTNTTKNPASSKSSTNSVKNPTCSKSSTNSPSFKSSHAGWVPITGDADTIAFGLETGGVVYYNGVYWASPEFLNNITDSSKNEFDSSSGYSFCGIHPILTPDAEFDYKK